MSLTRQLIVNLWLIKAQLRRQKHYHRLDPLVETSPWLLLFASCQALPVARLD